MKIGFVCLRLWPTWYPAITNGQRRRCSTFTTRKTTTQIGPESMFRDWVLEYSWCFNGKVSLHSSSSGRPWEFSTKLCRHRWAVLRLVAFSSLQLWWVHKTFTILRSTFCSDRKRTMSTRYCWYSTIGCSCLAISLTILSGLTGSILSFLWYLRSLCWSCWPIFWLLKWAMPTLKCRIQWGFVRGRVKRSYWWSWNRCSRS